MGRNIKGCCNRANEFGMVTESKRELIILTTNILIEPNLMKLMKKLFMIPVIFLSLLSLAQKQQEGQYYRRFKLDFMVFGFTRPLLDNIQNKYVFAFEPKYVISSRWEAGSRFELAYIGPYKEIRYIKS